MAESISFVLGTRPEIIKQAPVIRECQNRGIPFSIVHTGQHYSESLDQMFFEQLGLPVPDHNLAVGSASHGRQTGAMVSGLESFFEEHRPDIVLVQGDTNSVLAGGIAASKMEGVAVGHIEAGLRSYDQTMPEEVNRRVVDQVSNYLFAPTVDAKENLLNENIAAEQITVTGNTIVDAVEQNIAIARERSSVTKSLELDGPFALLTAHRAENVDDRERFSAILEGVARFSGEYDLPVVYPVHPRARSNLSDFELNVPSAIHTVDPLDFLDFLVLEDEAVIAFTDSGGVQEECCILGTPCVTVRDNTERPETVDVGANVVAGVKPADVFEGGARMLDRDTDWTNPLGDGHAADAILDSVTNHDD